MNPLETSILRDAIAHYGHEAQLRKVSQECIELALAISKYLDDGSSEGAIGEELADVEIMITQARMMMSASGRLSVDTWKRKKLERLKQRIAKEKS
jgi:NTP pyrophosphatase (non-canonical NTP hydrolase)